jgi:hypothetical protein
LKRYEALEVMDEGKAEVRLISKDGGIKVKSEVPKEKGC